VAWAALPDKRRAGIYLAAGGLLAIAVAFPWYIHVLPGADKVSAPGPLFYLPPLYQFQWWQFLMFAPVAIVAFVVVKKRRDANVGLKVVLWVTSAHLLASLVWSNDEAIMNILFRSAIWVTLPLWIILVWLVAQWRPPQVAYKIGAMSILVSLAALGAGWVYQDQFKYSEHISPDVLAAVRQLDLDKVTRIGTNGESRAYWLSVVTSKPVVWVQPARPAPAYQAAEELARCELGWLPDCATGFVSHWIIDKTVRQQMPVSITFAPNPTEPWAQLGKDAPWLEKVWFQGEAEVWATMFP
jgi:hypothetical protein